MNGDYGSRFRGQFKKLGEEAGASGVEISLCDPSGRWGVPSTGYEKYLALWPDGPLADEAWWRSRVEPWCGDFEGSDEEYAERAKVYSEFSSISPTVHTPPKPRNNCKS
jgi:hypothetical protein